jgi:chromosome segregation ATPase
MKGTITRTPRRDEAKAMTIEHFVNSVETRIWSLGRRLMQTDPTTQLREDVMEASDALRARYKELLHDRADLEATRKRIDENQINAALLGSAVEESTKRGSGEQAWRLALELDRARRQLTEDQERLPKLEQRCWSLDFQVRQMERRLARLQTQLNGLG